MPPRTRSDNASNSPYVVYDAFSGLNGGTGFGPWTVNITGTGGDYINGATYDSTGVVTEPDFDIWNDTNDGTGGGTYGVDVTTAVRPFTSALSPDQIFKFSDVLHYANQTDGGGSGLGWSLEDSSGNPLFDFHTAAVPGIFPVGCHQLRYAGDHGSLQLPDRRHIRLYAE